MNEPRRGFKKRVIARTVREKMNEWLDSIEDERLRERVADDYVVTGGAIASMLLGQKPNDYDVYMRSMDVARDLARYYCDRFFADRRFRSDFVPVIDVREHTDGVSVYIKSAGVADEGTDLSEYGYFETMSINSLEKYLKAGEEKEPNDTSRYHPRMITTNAITLSHDVQFITRFVGDPGEIHRFYDFVHCTCYYTPRDGLVINEDAMLALLNLELRYVGSMYPVCSLFRLRKFIRRGFTITAGELVKIAWDIAALDLDDWSVLQDQLVGVDAAYFQEVLDILKGRLRDAKPIDRTYLFEAINRVFDDDDPMFGTLTSEDTDE